MTLTPVSTPRVPTVLGTPEKPGPAGGGTDPAIVTLPGAALSALEDIKRACRDLQQLVRWQDDPAQLITLAVAIEDAAGEVAEVRDIAGIKADQQLRSPR